APTPGSSSGPTSTVATKTAPSTKGSTSTGGPTGYSSVGSANASQPGGAAVSQGTVSGPVPTATNLADGPPTSEPFRWSGAGVVLVPLSLFLLLLIVVGPPILTWIMDRPKDRAP
ncbi:MAG TPA: hypothetical protein VKY26_03170, partial [Actinomycetota bacterium]|nr:hypothetical protein [Actinomycetota bacterium]